MRLKKPLHFDVQYGGWQYSPDQIYMAKTMFKVDCNNRLRRFRKDATDTFLEHLTREVSLDCYDVTAEEAGKEFVGTLLNLTNQKFISIEVGVVSERYDSASKYAKVIASWWEPVVDVDVIKHLNSWLELTSKQEEYNKNKEIENLKARLALLEK